MMSAFVRSMAALGAGVIAVGHWFWICEHYGAPPHAGFWIMDGAVELYGGIFLIGVGVHALASRFWLDDPHPPGSHAMSEQR